MTIIKIYTQLLSRENRQYMGYASLNCTLLVKEVIVGKQLVKKTLKKRLITEHGLTDVKLIPVKEEADLYTDDTTRQRKMGYPDLKVIRKELPFTGKKERQKPGPKPKIKPIPQERQVVGPVKIKYKLVSQTNTGKAISAYVVLHPTGGLVAKIHIGYSQRSPMHVDVFLGSELIHQYLGPDEHYPFSAALSGLILADIRLFGSGVAISREEKSLGAFEKETYLPGLDRLKAAGYKVEKII